MTRLSSALSIAICLLLLALLGGCGGQGVPAEAQQPASGAQSGMAALLPPLPAATERAAAGLQQESSAVALNPFAKGGEADYRSGRWLIRSDRASVGWAMYRFGGNDWQRLLRFTADLRTMDGPAYVAVSDYTLGRWRFLGSAAGIATYDIPAGVGTDANAGLYLLIVAWDGSSFAAGAIASVRSTAEGGNLTVSGRITDDTGNPVPLAHVVLTAGPGDLSQDAYSLANGTYVLGLDTPGAYTLQIDGDSPAAPPQLSVVLASGDALGGIDFSYSPNRVRGRVVTADGQPLDNALVRISTSPQFESGSDTDETFTMPDGSYEFANVPVGENYFFVRAAGFAFTPQVVALSHAGGTSALEMTAQQNASTLRISGQVTNPVAGAPVAGAIIELRGMNPADRPGITAMTDEQGYYMLSGIAPDPFGYYEVHIGSLPPGQHLQVWSNNRQVKLIDKSATDVNFQVTPWTDN
jgi:hypothetical protein